MNIRESIKKALREQCFVYSGGLGNYGCMDPSALNFDPIATHPCNALGPSIACADCYGNNDWCGPGTAPGDCCQYPTSIPGCTDSTACNYDPNATVDDGSCDYASCIGCTDPAACNYDLNATIDDGSCQYPGCTDPLANNYDPSAGCNDNTCTYDVLGCTDPVGCNYNISATVDDGSCQYPGCIDLLANNYDSSAGCDDGTCTYDVLGCTDINAINYDSNATVDDNSCIYPVAGCTDILALNYDPLATVDDGSCLYEEEPEDCSNTLDVGCWVCKEPGSPGCSQLTTMVQVTTASSYGLQGFTTNQDCMTNTPCGKPNEPCEGLDNYVISNYTNWLDPNQGSIMDLDAIHFCEKCKYEGLNDVMCKCCEKDPCDKEHFLYKLNDIYNLEAGEFCKYCQYGLIQDPLCKCCKRFEKLKPKIKKDRPRLGEEIKRIKKLLK